MHNPLKPLSMSAPVNPHTEISEVTPCVSIDSTSKRKVDSYDHNSERADAKPVAGLLDANKSIQTHQFVIPAILQVKGLDSKKTLFSKKEFLEIQNRYDREGMPLVVFADQAVDDKVPEFLMAHIAVASWSSWDNQDIEPKLKQPFVIYGKNAGQIRRVDLFHIQPGSVFSHYVDALMQLNNPKYGITNRLVSRWIVAASIGCGIYGFIDLQLTQAMTKSMRSKEYQTSLNIALDSSICGGSAEVVEQILLWGADPNSLSPDDECLPLDSAIRIGNAPIVAVLLKYGADPSLESDNSMSAFELILEDEHKYLAPLFGLKKLEP
jgi:hypothetical protein